jgi:hypothetical protein
VDELEDRPPEELVSPLEPEQLDHGVVAPDDLAGLVEDVDRGGRHLDELPVPPVALLAVGRRPLRLEVLQDPREHGVGPLGLRHVAADPRGDRLPGDRFGSLARH